jgi:uncharacterized membrane protein YfcA
MKQQEFWGMVMVFAVLWVANMGGIGGGGMLVPVCMIFFRFNATNAIPLSNFSIFLSSVQRCLLNSKKSHPLKNGTGLLVDYNLAIVMLPAIISGVSVGGIIHRLLPALIINVFYIVLLAFLLSTLFKKFMAIRKAETEKLKAKEEVVPEEIEMTKPDIMKPPTIENSPKA